MKTTPDPFTYGGFVGDTIVKSIKEKSNDYRNVILGTRLNLPMGGQQCKLKIILNGDTIQSETKALCYQLQELPLDDATGYKIVELFNKAEDAVMKAKRVWLESQGFNGPWPHSLT